ncbi:MAG: hypothetical protein IT442_06350 [Phycisphaeraceae bacterium]|nr:hypothetical protein [Phycisphaeraceae bacterium]
MSDHGPPAGRSRGAIPARLERLIIGVGLLAILAAAGARFGPRLADAADKPATQPAPTSQPAPRPSTRHLIGLTDLTRRIGGAKTPVGRGITTQHVEGPLGSYVPDVALPQFNFVSFRPMSGPSQTSGHTTSTARILYGRKALLPAVSDVACYSSEDWIKDGYLRAGSPEPPRADGRRLQNHSWIGMVGPRAADALRRIDYVVDQQDVIVVVGVNNGANTPVPDLLASAYNVLAVGAESGNSSGGYTRVDTPGRCKPDLVAPGGQTSYTTPVVTAVAGRLLEVADKMADSAPQASKSPVIRAVLLAGAEKTPRWRPEPGHPLDSHLGAGLVRIDQSYLILTRGPVDPGRVRTPFGWDYRTINPDGEQDYDFHLTRSADEWSVILTWNRKVLGGVVKDPVLLRPRWNNLAYVADLDLILYAVDDQGRETQFAVSNSKLDNVEHLYLKNLPAGRYRLRVRRVDAIDALPDCPYALAWRFAAPPKPAASPPDAPGEPDEDEDVSPTTQPATMPQLAPDAS